MSERFKVQKVLREGKALCPRCELARWQKQEEEKMQHEANEQMRLKKKNMLRKHSVVSDKTIQVATIRSFNHTLGDEEHKNKKEAVNCIERYRQGEQFNLWITSPMTGVGKSHLAMGILKELSTTEKSCLFLDVDEMLRRVRGSISNTESKFTESYFINLAIEVDYLVLDDLGAETGDIESGKRATEYTSRILRAIQNGRQDKSTIITTNLSKESLIKKYDQKVVSRLLKNVSLIKFTDSVDKRIGGVDF